MDAFMVNDYRSGLLWKNDSDCSFNTKNAHTILGIVF